MPEGHERRLIVFLLARYHWLLPPIPLMLHGQRVDDLRQLTRLGRLHKVVVKSGFLRPEPILVLTIAGEGDQRHVRMLGRAAVLRVRDSGIGISADLPPNVFGLFVQGDRSLDRTEGGLGIGLTLVKQLAELHGGSVDAASRGPDTGSEFTVRLPLARNRDLALEPATRATEILPVNRRRLLVVDDNLEVANMLAGLLEVMGHEVRAVNDGPTAISVAAAYRPHAVFLDVGLPGMNGYEVARKFRSAPEHAHVTLIAFTGYGQDQDRLRAQEAGFHHHLVKPAEASQLAQIVDALPMER